ncbi:7TM-DISM domain-containing protein [Halomonas sp. LY9]
MDAHCCLKHFLIALLIGLLSWCAQAGAANTLSMTPEHPHYSLNNATHYWHTATPLSLREVLLHAHEFQPVESASELHFGYIQGDTWLTTRLHNASPRPSTWIVKFEYPF